MRIGSTYNPARPQCCTVYFLLTFFRKLATPRLTAASKPATQTLAPMVQMLSMRRECARPHLASRSTRRSNDLVLILVHHGVHNRRLVAVNTVFPAEWSTCHLFDSEQF